jgi:tetratricopeptide (TPR) repeat protein
MDEKLPRIDDLWDYDSLEASEGRFRAVLAQARAHNAHAYGQEVKTQIARTFSLRGRFDEAHAVLDEVEPELGGNRADVRYLLERGRTLNSAGERDRALPYFQQAFELAERLGEPFLAADALHMVAIAAPDEESLGWNLRAIEYVSKSGNEGARSWLGSLYNNAGWSYFEQGEYEKALDLFERALAARREQGQPAQERIARWCVGRALRALGRIPEALAIQRELEREPDHDGFVEEEIAECLLAVGEPEAAAPYFARAYERLSALSWVAADVERMDRLQQLGRGAG